VLWVTVGGETEERVDSSQSGVPGGGGVAPLGLEVVQEAADELGVEVSEVQLGGVLAGLVPGVGEQ
jgi:hypothetical protein